MSKDVDILLHSSFVWKDTTGDYDGINILGRGRVTNGQIQLEFSVSFAEYLMKQPMFQYPLSLLKLDDRSTNAYNIALKLAEHMSIYSNHAKGTANLIRVRSLLPRTNLPSIDSPSVKKNGWENRIKEPLEEALGRLFSIGVLTTWRYSHSKGVELTDAEADFSSFEEWNETLIYFELNDFPDLSKKLEKREQEKQPRLQNKIASKKKAADK